MFLGKVSPHDTDIRTKLEEGGGERLTELKAIIWRAGGRGGVAARR